MSIKPVNIFLVLPLIILIICSGCTQNKEIINSNNQTAKLFDYAKYSEGCPPIRMGLYFFGDNNYDLGLEQLSKNPGAINYTTIGANMVYVESDFNYDECIKYAAGSCYYILDCIVRDAVHTLDAKKCESLPTNQTIIAVSTSHGGEPDETMYVNYRSACLLQVKFNQRIKQDKDFCAQLGEGLKDYCVKQRLIYEQINGTLESCNRFYSAGARDNCFIDVAVKEINSSICTRFITDSEEKLYACYKSVGSLMNDTSVCNLIPEAIGGQYDMLERHYYCLKELALRTGNKSICNLIPSQSDNRRWCLGSH